MHYEIQISMIKNEYLDTVMALKVKELLVCFYVM
jgi:hypothetical protein